MSIGILGAGALGQLLAHQLYELNEPVVLLSQPDREPIQVTASYTDIDNRTTATEFAFAPSAQAQPLSLVMVLTKAQDCLAALTPLLTWLPPKVPIVLLHNGLGPQQQAIANWPKHSWWAGSISDGALRQDRYHVRHTGAGLRKVGLLSPAKPHTRLPTVLPAPLAQLGFEFEADILLALWQKLTVNLVINPLTTRDNIVNGALTQAKYDLEIRTLCQEIAAVGAQLGYVESAASIQQRVRTIAAATAHNRSSMLQDHDHQRPLELEAITGYFLAKAKQYQLACPCHQKLYHQLCSE